MFYNHWKHTLRTELVSVTEQNQRHFSIALISVVPLLVWAEKKKQTKVCCQKYQSAVILSPLCYCLKKIPNQKNQKHYNICVKKHINYPGSVKSRSPKKKTIIFPVCTLVAEGRNKVFVLVNDLISWRRTFGLTHHWIPPEERVANCAHTQLLLWSEVRLTSNFSGIYNVGSKRH